MTSRRRPRRSSTEAKLWAEIHAAVDRWCVELIDPRRPELGTVVEKTDWSGEPLLITPLPKDARFDPVRTRRVIDFFLLLKQQKGRWAGRAFRLFDWQVRWEIAPVFGLVRDDGLRQIRTAWIEKPRKNGKSTECSGLGLYLWGADREPGAEVYAAAGDKMQAGIVFNESRKMAEGSTAIVKAVGVRALQRGRLEHPRTGAIFRALSSEGSRQHGLNVHGAVIDEVHVHKNPDTIDALETGVGSREQPLILFITTADAGDGGTVYATKREYLEGVAAGTIDDPTFYGVVFGVDDRVKGFDPFADATLLAANPGVGLTCTWDYLRKAAATARQSPSELNRYLRLHLGIRTKQETKWLTLAAWDAAAGMATDEAWRGAIARGGLDLSTSTDLTSFVMVRPDAGGVAEGCDVHAMFWIPEERVDELEQKTSMPLRQWAKAGFLRLTEGNVVDYAKVRADIVAEIGRLGCAIGSIGYDPWNATETVQLLEAEGYVMVPVRQGYGSLSAPAKQLERLVVGSTPKRPLLRHGGQPVLRWNADCVTVRQDDNGNVKPVKPDRLKTAKRIDGMVALIMAIREAMLGTTEEASAAESYLSAMAAAAASKSAG